MIPTVADTVSIGYGDRMRIDGRDARWEQHRVTRRAELVSHALRAIRVHGPGVGMDEIAARAGTSKTVIYRHFGDRAGLYEAVVDAVDTYIHEGLTAAIQFSDITDLGDLAGTLTDAYLTLVERDPHIYRFVMHRPSQGPAGSADPFEGLTEKIAVRVSAIVAHQLTFRGLDPAPAPVWGHGLVGFVRAAADHWISSEPRGHREDVVRQVTRLFSPAFAGALTAPTDY